MSSIWQAERICLTWQATGNLTFEIHTALGGAALSLAKSITLGATSGFQTREFSLLDVNDYPLEFSLIQFKLVPTSSFRGELQDGHLMARKVGTYVNGSHGLIWQTHPPIELA